MKKEITLTIDGQKTTVPAGATIMEAADSIGIHVPRFCHHAKLSTAAACRVCVVEVEGMKNFPASCSTAAAEGMQVRTNSPAVSAARRDIIELILDNHPRDCQVCDRNNQCDLQKLAQVHNIKEYRYEGERKRFPKDTSSFSIVRDPEKCVLCGKCERVCAEIQGVNALSYTGRGFRTNIATAYDMDALESVCVNCGQCTLFCPTGALTEKEDIDRVFAALNDPGMVAVVQVAPAVRVAIGEGFGLKPGEDMTGQTVAALRMLGFKTVFDTQFSADLTIMEEAHELIERLSGKGKLPMFTSCSPAWIKFCEHFHPESLENLSTCKSPQQMMGALIKTYYAGKMKLDPARIFSVSIMPCTAKKFEAARPEMEASSFRDVDAVLTTRELIKMIKRAGIDFTALKPAAFDAPLGESTGAATIFGVTGGVMEAALRTAYETITGKNLPELNFTAVRGLDGIKEAEVVIGPTTARVAIAYSLANAHKLLTEIVAGKRLYHFVEIMSCPGGCIGGGGQPYPPYGTEAMARALYESRSGGLYSIDERKTIRKSHENPEIKQIYAEFLGRPLGELSHKLLHTHYHKRRPAGLATAVGKTVNV